MPDIIFNKKTLLIALAVCAINLTQAQSDEVEYQESPSGIGEDNDDRLRRQQEEESKQQHYYSSPGGCSVSRSSEEDGANPPDPQGDPGAPIDGGLSVLLAAGAAYGVKRMRKGNVDGKEHRN